MDEELLRRLGRRQRDDLEAEPELGLPRPFEGRERELLLDEVFARLEGEGEGEGETEVETGTETESEPEVANTVELRRPSRGAVVVFASLLAAASVLLWWGVAGREPAPQLAQLPSYEITRLQGGVASSRAEAPKGELPTLRADSAIDWVFTPAQAIRSPLAVAMGARSVSGGEAFAPRVDAEISAEGAVRLRGDLDAYLELEAGQWTLFVFVAPPDRLPSALVSGDDTQAWQTIAVDVKIVDE